MHPLLLNTSFSNLTSTPYVYGYFQWSPYGWWNQGETFGSQNGITYWFPMVGDQKGVWGPSRSALAANNFTSSSTSENTWPGVGLDKWTTPYDINWYSPTFSSSTGYIGLTFGNAGHIGLTSVNEIVSAYRWIPERYRVYDNSRHYRAFSSGGGITLSEYIPNSLVPTNISDTPQNYRTPWLKRKVSFLRKELQNIMRVMGNTGFYLSGMEMDDEIYIYNDYRLIGRNSSGSNVGNTTFYRYYMYPSNSSLGSTWYASFTGSSAAPDSLISQGITSFRAFLLNHGYTTNSSSSKYVDGLTAMGSLNVANNIGVQGSAHQSGPAEYSAAITDWYAYHWQDYANDFKSYNNLTSDNNFIGSYGYYRTDVGMGGYTASQLGGTFTGLLKQINLDYVPYPDVTPISSASNSKKTAYYAYNSLVGNVPPGNVQRAVAGNIDSIWTYGTVNFMIKQSRSSTKSLDRQKGFFGNSYGYGSSFGIYSHYDWQMSPYLGYGSDAPIWYLPSNYLNSGLAAQLMTADKSFELIGMTASRRYDTSGAHGSKYAGSIRSSTNRAPGLITWHFNPVWGITAINLDTTYNPANYIPLYGPHSVNGITCGAISLQYIKSDLASNPSSVWTSDHFDSAGFPIPGNTLPAGTLYNHYWTHWYPMAFIALLSDVNWGRQVALANVYRAAGQLTGEVPNVSGSNWNGIQRPINVWLNDQKLYLEGRYESSSENDLSRDMILATNYYIPTGLTYGFWLQPSTNSSSGVTQYTGQAGPMYYENMRHQFLNKAGRFIHWNPVTYSSVTSATGGQVLVDNAGLPQLVNGITCYGVCGAIAMDMATKVGKILNECNTVSGGMIRQTVYLAPANMDETSYLISGGLKPGGGFLWRITFAHPVTNPSLQIRGSDTGTITTYSVSGVTDYINNGNNKFGVWWQSGSYEYPIVVNPPIPEALRRGIVSLPENPQFQFNATSMVSSRNPIDSYFVSNNPALVCYLHNSPYGYWNQNEKWGSQNGLTYMWPMVKYAQGFCGPSRTYLNSGLFSVAGGASVPDESGWTGIGDQPGYDVDWSATRWNTSTGYIGFTFGSTGFIPFNWVQQTLDTFSWIPNAYRLFYPSRTWRAFDNLTTAKEGSEVVRTTVRSSDGYVSKTFGTPWVKRKSNFLRQELKAWYLALSQRGFTMSNWECDDEYFYGAGWDLRSVGGIGGVSGNSGPGNTYFYNAFMYPTFAATGASWYANYRGTSAAPDCLLAKGITSFRGFLLTQGFTTTTNNWRYVDGLTALGNSGVTGNIAVGGSQFQFFGWEYYNRLKEWTACFWQDFIDDFKIYNGLTSDNSFSGNYNYFKTNLASFNHKQLGWTYPSPYPYLSNPLNKNSSDLYAYPTNIKSSQDESVHLYYSYNDAVTNIGVAFQEETSIIPGDSDSISAYGSGFGSPLLNYTSNSPLVLDRNLDVRGNCYFTANSGRTYGVSPVSNWYLAGSLASKYGSSSPEYNSTDAVKWFPPRWLGSDIDKRLDGKPGVLLNCYACAETMGQTGFFRYDPTGVCGSSAANQVKVGFDRAPYLTSWHLNPVWGITLGRLSNGSVLGPANYVPSRGLEIRDGMTWGSHTLKQIAGYTYTIPYYDNVFDTCGNPLPGVTLPAGTIYTHYWTHWYPIGFMGLLVDVKWGRHIARVNVGLAAYQRKNPQTATRVPGTVWFGVQKPMSTWLVNQRWTTDTIENTDISSTSSADILSSLYYVPQGITFNYLCKDITQTVGATAVYGEAGPMYYENIRHQYLNKTGRFNYWNPFNYSATTSISNTVVASNAGVFPRYYPKSQTSNPQAPNGITFYGACGADMMYLARKVNKVVGECHTLGNGLVYETISLDPLNMDERSYLASGAQLTDGSYLWRITFAHPATQSPIIVRGALTGITTAYSINGVTDYINIPNSKFGIWWSTNYYEMPIIENPPISEAERLGVLNLPGLSAFSYNPLTMNQAQ